MSYHDDNSYQSEDEAILSLYRRSSNEKPSSDLDKLINAAARREASVELENAKKSIYRSSFWNKLRLPISFAGAFVMTLTLAHVMWPVIAPKHDGMSGVQAISDKLSTASQNEGEKIISDAAQDARYLREKYSKNTLSSANSEQLGNTQIYFDSPNDINISDNLNRNSHERDKWISEIISLAEAGQFNEMNKELKHFVKQYPDYPIKQYIKPHLK
ncbi:hypothetical protein [Pleionea sediminis]|uniref:hypothetical protein n=1 Tax=Pleionea sediminis TaxID=2569479 RepID=UPI0011846E64|nr:hypothetical protein [Pleionea sediminis]